MRPPICVLCGKYLEAGEGGLIYFKERPSDLEWIQRMKEKGMVGHPPYAEWFCGEHISEAEKLSHLTVDQAIRQLKKQD